MDDLMPHEYREHTEQTDDQMLHKFMDMVSKNGD